MTQQLREVPDCLQSAEAYTLLRRRLIRFFAGRRCDDPSDLADDTVARVIEAVNKRDQEIRDVTQFAHRIAHNIYVDLVRSKTRREPPPESVLVPVADRPGQRAMCLERCLRRLPADQRELIEAYFVDRRRLELARSLGLTLGALRIRICHLKRDVSRCVETCVKPTRAK